MCSDFLSREFDLEVLVILRHPAAFFASMKRKNWGINPNHFLIQKDLMTDYLYKYEDQLKKASSSQEYIIMEWICVNSVLFDYSKNNKRFHIVKHEDICQNPVASFRNIYEKYDIPFTKKIERKVAKSIKPDRCNTWKEELASSEIEWVKSKTYALASEFYSEWQF